MTSFVMEVILLFPCVGTNMFSDSSVTTCTSLSFVLVLYKCECLKESFWDQTFECQLERAAIAYYGSTYEMSWSLTLSQLLCILPKQAHIVTCSCIKALNILNFDFTCLILNLFPLFAVDDGTGVINCLCWKTEQMKEGADSDKCKFACALFFSFTSLYFINPSMGNHYSCI